MIYLSAPDVEETELSFVSAAMKSGWVAPLGPEVVLLPGFSTAEERN